MVAIAHGLLVVEIPIRFRRRIGRSKGASQSLLKGIQVGLAMVWHILIFDLPNRPSVAPSAPVPEAAAGAKAGVTR
jgi:hypothetical protein